MPEHTISYFLRLLEYNSIEEGELRIAVEKREDEYVGKRYQVPTLIEGILHLLSEEGFSLEIIQYAQWPQHDAYVQVGGMRAGTTRVFTLRITKDQENQFSIRVGAPVLAQDARMTPDSEWRWPVALSSTQFPEMVVIEDDSEGVVRVDMGVEVANVASFDHLY